MWKALLSPTKDLELVISYHRMPRVIRVCRDNCILKTSPGRISGPRIS